MFDFKNSGNMLKPISEAPWMTGKMLNVREPVISGIQDIENGNSGMLEYSTLY